MGLFARCALGVTLLLGLASPAFAETDHDVRQINRVVRSYNKAVLDQRPRVLCARVLPPSQRPGMKRCVREITKAMAPSNTGLAGRDNTFRLVGRIEVRGEYAYARCVSGDGSQFSATFLFEHRQWWLQVFD